MGSIWVWPWDLMRTLSTGEACPETLLTTRPYPLEKDVRETKLITRTVNDTRVNANLSFLLRMFLFAMEKMGTTIFLTGRCPSLPLAFIKRGAKTANVSDTTIEANPTVR